jgi:transcriptional antiterminator NusG
MLDEANANIRKWYAIQTYSGYERAVERNLKQKVLSEGMTNKIFDVLVPLAKTVKIKMEKK